MKTLYLAWQDPSGRSWHPIGRLRSNNGEYSFVYTQGVKEAPKFTPFPGMTDLNSEYRSRELFPIFANRLLTKGRPDYKEFLEWLNLRTTDDDPFAMLARGGGVPENNSFMVFPCPEPDKGSYHVHFFSHGLRHLPEFAVEQANALSPGTRLYLMPDPQNPVDLYAIALRTGSPMTIVGYCPRFLVRDFHSLLKANRSDPNKVRVEVEKVNKGAPIQLRLLCNLTSPWPQDFHPCSEPSFAPLT